MTTYPRLRRFIRAWTEDPKHSDPDAHDAATVAALLTERDRLAEALTRSRPGSTETDAARAALETT